MIAAENSCCLRSLAERYEVGETAGGIAGWPETVEKKVCNVGVIFAAFLSSRSRWDYLSCVFLKAPVLADIQR